MNESSIEHVDKIELSLKISEPISHFSNDIGLFICEFKTRDVLLERIYRELRGPPVFGNLQNRSL